MEEVELLRECAFLGHGNMQHVSGGLKENHGLQYHVYLILVNVDLKDAASFAYFELMYRDVQNQREVLLGDAYPFYMSDESESDDDNESRNTTTVEMKVEWDKNSAIAVCQDYSAKLTIEEN